MFFQIPVAGYIENISVLAIRSFMLLFIIINSTSLEVNPSLIILIVASTIFRLYIEKYSILA